LFHYYFIFFGNVPVSNYQVIAKYRIITEGVISDPECTVLDDGMMSESESSSRGKESKWLADGSSYHVLVGQFEIPLY